MAIVTLAGGTGGAKLARGLLEEVGSDLVVVANTADDIEIHGAYVSPDPDLVLFRLADRLDPRGWGLAGDTFTEIGSAEWFQLGDEDLAIGRERLRRLQEGQTLTQALDALRGQLGVRARVLPMCDEPARTFVDGVPFQEWMIRAGGKAGAAPVGAVDVRYDAAARITPEVEAAVAGAEAVIIGPSNPVISIEPILDTPGMADALAGKPVVAVSPLVGGAVVKGPTAAFFGGEASLAAIASWYGDRVAGWVADERVEGRPTLVTDVDMPDVAAMARVARETLAFAIGFCA